MVEDAVVYKWARDYYLEELPKTATKEDANDAIKNIREKIAEIYGQSTAQRVIIQYGGSMNPTNAKELLEMSDIDGGLIGGASLKAEDFAAIVNFEKD